MKQRNLLQGRAAAVTGMVLLLLILLVAVFAPALAPYDPWAMGTPYLPPSSEHLLGTNDIGQDILSKFCPRLRRSSQEPISINATTHTQMHKIGG